MDIEFHYYITCIIARRAGFRPEDAHIIAYSSQYTDDNDTVYSIDQDGPNAYSNYISQTMNILKPQKELMRIYPVFHFMPGTLDEIAGDSARRRDGKLHLMNVIPDNMDSKKCLSAAFDSQNLYRVGIATHMYADTFAHQNFVGFEDGFNDMKGLLESLIPSIGHADAKHQPDLPALIWEDERLVPSHTEIDNKKRFLEAASCLFDFYSSYLKISQNKESVIKEIDEAIGDYGGTEEDRIERYKALIGTDYQEYDKKSWFNDAVVLVSKDIPYTGDGDTVPRSEAQLAWNENFKETHWLKFQEAVKTHQRYALETAVAPIFKVMEFENF